MLGIPYHIQEIAQYCQAKDLFQGEYAPQVLNYVAFDTRKIAIGAKTLFVALKTDHRDGHRYIEKAIAQGVKNFLVDRPLTHKGINYILVDDTLDALQKWALLHRRRFEYPVIAITGSNGKTIVKEWLASLLEADFQLVKSPMSYNSQLGVPLSLLQMHPQADLAIIEAGISKQGEMEILAQLIAADWGIFTHFGTAHASGFASPEEKLQEKVRLFDWVEKVFVHSYQPEVLETLKQKPFELVCIGPNEGAKYVVEALQSNEQGWAFDLRAKENLYSFQTPFSAQADLENVLLAIMLAFELRLEPDTIQRRVQELRPLNMRTELITDNPEVVIINDSYNSDRDSIYNAFSLLKSYQDLRTHQIILTDVPHQGEEQQQLQTEVLAMAEDLVGKSQVRTVGPVFAALRSFQAYPDLDALILDFRYEDFRGSTVLLKGAREYALERLIPLLNPRQNAASFRLNLNTLRDNYRFLKTQVPSSVRTMCMVKAQAYGSGGWEIAKVLESEGADYLAVAYASEAIELRRAGIEMPIMVMNADLPSIPTLLKFEIEPEVYSLAFLEHYLRAARMSTNTEWRIHLKFETGMGRLGFQESDTDDLFALLWKHPQLTTVSIMSHLAAADDPAEDAYSLQQIETLKRIGERFEQEFGICPLRHILNTAGVLRFPEHAMDMVRLGIGLYGINPTMEQEAGSPELREIATMAASISQIQHYDAGQSIGYGRSQRLERPSRIATVPIGYADGIPRSLSNGKARFLVRGKRVPVVGRICMDMLMLDVTDVTAVKLGDEVVLMGHQDEAFLSVCEIAEWAGTIPYEILVRISPRVRRIYLSE